MGNPALTQRDWYIDRVNGSVFGAGTRTDPVDSAATIRRRWGGNKDGVRPQIGNIPTLTITLLQEAAAQPDIADPWSVLLDVDYTTNTKTILRSDAPAQAASGTLTTVSSFARTPASGQIQITDSGRADFSPLVLGLFVDTTSGAVAWLYEPKTTSNIGLVTKPKAAINPGDENFGPADRAIVAGDAYATIQLPRIYFGAHSETRQFPLAASGTALSSFATVYIYRLWVTSTGGPPFSDTWMPQTTRDNLTGVGPKITLQECRIDPMVKVNAGTWWTMNCFFGGSSTQTGAFSRGDVYLFAGGSYVNLNAGAGGRITIDGDFVFDGSLKLTVFVGSVAFLGFVSRWGNSSSTPFILIDGGLCHTQPLGGAFGNCLYGTVGAGNKVIQFNPDGIQYFHYLGNALDVFKFDSTGPHWTFPTSGSNSWAFNQATGRFGGAGDGVPAANTFANLDAAVNAPGFGGTALDPVSGCFLRRAFG